MLFITNEIKFTSSCHSRQDLLISNQVTVANFESNDECGSMLFWSKDFDFCHSVSDSFVCLFCICSQVDLFWEDENFEIILEN